MSESVILNGDQIYLDELIRENARLTVQHEADRQVIKELRDHIPADCDVEELEALKAKCRQYEEHIACLSAKLQQAISDLHSVMAGGNACDVCVAKCLMGEGNCKPVWRGEKTE